MTDLTILHLPSTLFLPLNEAGLRFTSNRQSPPALHTFLSTPMVTVETVDTSSPPPSPAGVQNKNFLSPPRRTFRSRERLRVTPTRRSFSAPPSCQSNRTRTVDLPSRSLPRSKPPDTGSGRSSSIPVVPPTTLCESVILLDSKTR
jgi:hypothetical protein